MTAAVAEEPRLYTPEDLLSLPDSKGYELVDGQLVERNMGAESSWVGGRLFLRIGKFNEDHRQGSVFPADNGYQCFAHSRRLVRRPDVSFVKEGRLPGDRLPTGWIRIAPDLAVEVVSPNDKAEELQEKLEDYRKARVPLVWVIYPRARVAMVYRPDGPTTELSEDSELTGEDVLPGFRCPLREVLPPVPAAGEAGDPTA
jgi:Uma2 family endonuclease